MVEASSGLTAAESAAPTASQPWPSRIAASYGLAVIILATMLNFFDASAFSLLIQRIKVDFGLDDEQLGFLGGPANIIFYALVGIPLATLVDFYPRKIVLACGIAITGGITALGGLAQNFGQLIASRVLVGAGASPHGPGAYSMLSDYFPPQRVPRAIGFLQLGFIGGGSLGLFLGGPLVMLTATWPTAHWLGLTIHGWQWVLIMVGAPGVLIALLLLAAKEPARRGRAARGERLPWKLVLHELAARRAIYLPMFIGLAMSAAQSFGLAYWRTPLMIRKYGWNEAQVGRWGGAVFLVSSLVGAAAGTVFVEWLSKRYKDAHLRAAAILFALAAPCEILAPMMPSAVASMLLFAGAGVCGLASAVPQNAAIQRITPNELRGRVTAVYLFMFTVFGGLGVQLIGSVTQRVFHSPDDLWKAMVLTGAVLMPLAAFIMFLGVRPYGREVQRLDALERPD